jgi:hypothetical protein
VCAAAFSVFVAIISATRSTGQASPPALIETPAQVRTTQHPTADATLRLDKAMVIGASVSAGFMAQWNVTLPPPPGSPAGTPGRERMMPVNLADVLGGMSADPAARPASVASEWFFTQADEMARSQIDAAQTRSPELVFALDYLFWRMYGSLIIDDPEQRMAWLEDGLNRLDKIISPMIVGDLPDMRHADKMLQPSQVPTKETLARANERIRQWAKGRKNVVIMPLSETIAGVLSGKNVAFGGIEMNNTDARGLFTIDGLHATPEGLAVIADDALWRLQQAGLLAKDATWVRDRERALTRMIPAERPSRRTRERDARPNAKPTDAPAASPSGTP